MDQLKQKKVCVVGVGRWGKNHCKTLNAMGCLAGVVETDEANLQFVKDNFPGIKYFSNIKAAVKEGFDGFTVATPAETHFAITEYLLENKNHVWQYAKYLADFFQDLKKLLLWHLLLYKVCFQQSFVPKALEFFVFL